MKEKYYVISSNGETTQFEVEGDEIKTIDGKDNVVEISEVDENDEYTVVCNGKTHKGELVSLKQNRCEVVMNGNTYTFAIQSEIAHQRAMVIESSTVQTVTRLTAPLPGLICDVLVNKDQSVQKGEALLILEAMKMQNEIVSPISGKITKINVHKGDNVMKDQLMLEISIEK